MLENHFVKYEVKISQILQSLLQIRFQFLHFSINNPFAYQHFGVFQISGTELIPEGVVALLGSSVSGVLSGLAVQARNKKVFHLFH